MNFNQYTIEQLKKFRNDLMNTTHLLKDMNADWKTLEEVDSKWCEINFFIEANEKVRQTTYTDSMFS